MKTASPLDKEFGVIPPDINARLDGDENVPVFNYFREPTLDELIAHQVEYVESWGEPEAAQPEVMWLNHMSLVTVRILAKLRDEQGKEAA
jgi:hypothetical protein